MLDFAVDAQARDGLERFLHVSTAYVSGRYEGTFRERQLDAGQSFRNTYEETKADAEQIVTLARELGPAIARPSIVVGESDSGWTPAFNVLYWPLRAFSRGMFKEVPALADGHVDIVPIDYVADGARAPARPPRGRRLQPRLRPQRAQRSRRSSTSPRTGSASRIRSWSSRVGPEHVGDDQGDVFVPYFDMRVVFDDARARAVLGPAGIEAPILRDYFGKLMEYAEAARWGKRR